MALEGPRLIYTRKEEEAEPLAQALKLARQIEELLEEAPPSTTRSFAGPQATRIVRAMSASLVDELEAIVRGTRKATLC